MHDTLIRDEFPRAHGLKYLDHAAVAPWPARTKAAVAAFAEENIVYGASRYHLFSAKEAQLREQLRRLINAPSVDDIALMKNTSDAISAVASSLDWRQGDNVVTSAEEFPSNWIPWDAQQRHGVSLRQVDVRGEQPEQALMAACDERTRVLAISSVQFSSGIKMDLETLGAFCQANGILFCVDAIQSIGACAVDAQTIQADFVMADAHKWMLGPEGIALFYSRPAARNQLTLHQHGWHMTANAGHNYGAKTWEPCPTAKRFEPGSNNLLGIHALSASLSLIEELGMRYIETNLTARVSQILQGLDEIERVSVITPVAPERRAGIVSFQVAGADPLALHKTLNEQQVICAHRRGALRFSPHYYISEQIINDSLDILSSSI